MTQNSFDPIDPGGKKITAEMWQKQLLNRIAVLALLVVGLFGVWMLFRAMTPQAPPPTLASDPLANGKLPDIPLPAPASVVSASETASPMLVLPTVPPLAGSLPPTLPMVAPDATPAALSAPLTPQHETIQKKTSPSSGAFVSQPLTAKTTGKHQFGVQMGVFSVVANAENLYAKIQSQGIPVFIETRPGETRVHVGPFPSRAEAKKTRDKLEKLGMGKGMLVVLKK